MLNDRACWALIDSNTKTGDGCLQFLYGAGQLLQPSERGQGIVALNGGELGDERWAHVAVSFEQRYACTRSWPEDTRYA